MEIIFFNFKGHKALEFLIREQLKQGKDIVEILKEDGIHSVVFTERNKSICFWYIGE